MGRSIKQLSKSEYTLRDGHQANYDDLKMSCLLRIADASEAMAANFVRLQNDLEMYKRWYNERGVKIEKLEHSNRSLRGVITRLKKVKT